jgi:hypothetical protein
MLSPKIGLTNGRVDAAGFSEGCLTEAQLPGADRNPTAAIAKKTYLESMSFEAPPFRRELQRNGIAWASVILPQSQNLLY